VGPLLVFPDLPIEVARALKDSGRDFQTVDGASAERHLRPDEGWIAAVLSAGPSLDRVVGFAKDLRTDLPDIPVLCVVAESEVERLAGHADVFSDFCVAPLREHEFFFRLERLVRSSEDAVGDDDALIVYGPLMINPVTYQAVLDGDPLDLTYMEYELLKYFAQRPGRVCTREVLLGQVWGYEYYGGARTVDVHVRRLRAKLGEPHAGLIGTVRSVGYRFGKSQWG